MCPVPAIATMAAGPYLESRSTTAKEEVQKKWR
jgi:hypothetical protein